MERAKLLLRLNEETKEELREIAEKQGISVTALINVLIHDYLKQSKKERVSK